MKAWEEFLNQETQELGVAVVSKWLRSLRVIRFDAGNLYLEAPDAFKALWFEEHIRPKLQTRLLNSHQKPIKVHLQLPPAKEEVEVESEKKIPSPQKIKLNLEFESVSDTFRFDHFVKGAGNLLATQILHEPSHFNPIYIFGRSGTGKTHLLKAAAWSYKEKGLKALYVRADTFTDHVVSAIRSGEIDVFRKCYRTADVLLVDDIEIFAKKAATQEEFFHTFNTLHTAGKQLIFASQHSPAEQKFIEPRLISRFEWGIVVPLQKLDPEGMRQVLMQKAKEHRFSLDVETSEFLIQTFGNNLSHLLQALEALILRLSRARNMTASPGSARELLKDLIEVETKAVLTPGKIVRGVAEYYGIRVDDILGKSQNRECAFPRQIAMHLCRHQLHLPYTKIGDIFARDHSTVMTSVKLIEKGISDKDLELIGSLNSIKKAFEN